jgi:hypothetical protein
MREPEVADCNCSSSRSANWTRRWRVCSASTRTQSSDWRRRPAWESTRHSRSSPKWVRRQQRFLPPKELSSWVGACPGDEESGGVSKSHRSPKGNRHMRRILNQSAHAAVKVKGSIFEIVYRRLVPRLGHKLTIGAIAHRLCRLIWIILHRGVRYEERGPAVSQRSRKHRTNRMIRELRSLGYRVESMNLPAT